MNISAAAATAGVMLFPLVLVYAGVMDLVTLKIRNGLVLALGAAWIVLAPLAGFGAAEMGWSLAVAALVFAITFIFFAFGWIGGGDAKLATVSALWFQPQEALLYFSYAALLGGFLTLIILQLRSRLVPVGLLSIEWIARLRDRKAGVPYGAAMAPAALIVFPQTDWLARAVF
jgi:prepilin peptidase CpaA